MMPGIGVVRGVPNNRNLGEQIERQMGCMGGFIQLFDRQQMLTGKRFYSTKRLPSYSDAGSASPSEKSEISMMYVDAPEFPFSASPDGSASSPENHLPTSFTARHAHPLPVFEVKDGLKASWKLREAPRLSLDSRANVDAKGKLRPHEIQRTPAILTGNGFETSENRENQEKQRRSPNVVARLMGLEELPFEEQPMKPELRRSASESRVTRDLSPIPFVEGFRFQKQDNYAIKSRDKPEASRQTPALFQRKCFEAQEFFPEPKRVGSLYTEIEKRLRMRGIEEPARDLETLKQILEALQLKGLLHTKQTEHQEAALLSDFQNRLRRSSAVVQPPIVVIKPAPKPPPRLAGRESLTLPFRSMPRRLSAAEPKSPARIPRDRLEIDREFCTAGRQLTRLPEPNVASRNPSDGPKRRRPLKDEGPRSPLPRRQVRPAQSPDSSPKSFESGQMARPKALRPTAHIPHKEVYSTAEDDTFTSVSEISISSPLEFESARAEDYKSGRNLLERCDKLLHSIAAITSSAEQVIPRERELSPVSVLESTFLSDDSPTRSLPKGEIGFNDNLTARHEDHGDHLPASTTGSHENHHHDEYAFVLDVLRESGIHRSADEAFSSLETRHCAATSPTLHRRLLFDTVTELLDRKLHLPPWQLNFSRAIAPADATSLVRVVWDELCLIRQRIPATDVMEAARTVIKKDMAAGSDRDQGWGVSGTEISDAVLQIERLVFKDVVADTIRELADLAGRWRRSMAFSRRKLAY